ncbi:MAG: ABC transporter ATP-binding protein/permease [Clostridia bacterium]|nr:ABC transporter ATP-binding protein/permease [Clostridia bacterium]
MLQLNDITKEYVTGDSTVHALRGVSLKFRESEFVSILGQSGCGKTTLLNIIGGLDQYTDGDLIINGKSTKEFKDRDWDTYRNHSIGFIFQSYNLIPHQTVLANVEIALTLAGVSKKERRERAIKALETVGLGDQINKKPNQMSGGQMQRVAIARALINNPDILLADEPTGALDSETSVQVMDLLKEIAKNRLVIMVTHNPELANQYSTRIINLLDGQVVNDSNPVLENESVEALASKQKSEPTPSKGKKKKTSMSFLTALSLSLNNLMTKKGRTFLTAFAGSIGIIGIALILSVSTGVNAYIKSIEESTMSSYPIEINESSMDTMSLLGSLLETNKIEDFSSDTIYSNDIMIRVMESFASGLTKNDLVSLKQYLDSDKANTIKNNATDIKYIYDAGLNTYTPVLDDNGNTVRHEKNKESLGELLNEIGLGNFFGDASASLDMLESNSWTELVGSSEYVSSQYQLVAGKVPDVTNPYEVVLITDQNNQISDFILYTIGIKSTEELKKWVNDQRLVLNGEKNAEDAYQIPSLEESAESFIGYEFKIIPDSELYKLDNDGRIVERSNDEIEDYLKEDAISVKVVGIMKPVDSSNSLAVLGSVGYTSALMNQIIDLSNNSAVIKAQLESSDRNLQTGLLFNGYNPNTDLIDAIIGVDPQYRDFIASMAPSQKVEILKTVLGSTALSILAEQPYGEFTSDDLPMIKNALSSISDSTVSLVASAILNDTDENILKIFNQMLVTTTYDEYMEEIGYINKDVPKQILIYPKDFDAKDVVKGELDAYNNSLPEDSNKRITYSDPVASLMGSITTIVDAITYVLIAFVSISLIVSSIMIGIITYISVLERTKEIGILRAVGASKKDISRVFNAETLIVGFAAGAIGIIVTLVLDLIITAILFALTQIATLKAVLDFWPAIILILISMGLTFIAGLVPSKIAAKKDPVIALRSE